MGHWKKRTVWTFMGRKRGGYCGAADPGKADIPSFKGSGNTDFNLLNESCFILIAPFDIFGRGLYWYTFEGVCRECPDLKLDDGAIRVFINTKGKNKEDFSREFLEFMEYIGKTTDETAGRATSGRIRQIHERVCRIRKSEKAGVRYLQRWEELAYARCSGIRSRTGISEDKCW